MDGANAGEGRLSVRVLGRFEVRRDDRPIDPRSLGSRKQRHLLQVLLVERGRAVGVDRIVEILWDEPPRQAQRQVATLVSRLRGVLGRDVVEGGPSAYRFRAPDPTAVDLDEAQRLTEEAERRLDRVEGAIARVAADRAVALLERGPLLEDEPYAEWADAARAEAVLLLRRARACLWRAALATGDPGAAAAVAERAIALDPLDEEAARALMVAFDAAGSKARALAVFDRLRRVLRDELGVDPTAETEAVRATVAGGGIPSERGTLAAAGAEESAPPPREAVDPTFVGREAELRSLTAAWTAATERRGSLLLVVGEAGIGKSTLARRAVGLARATGGLVLEARCYVAERSLFLQPVADALRPLVLRSSPSALRDLVGDAATGLARIVPDLATALSLADVPVAAPELEHRRAFEATATVLRALSARQPVLLFLDDLHATGSATLEFLHYLVRAEPASRLLVLATVRDEEGDEVRRLLGGIASELPVGPLSAAAVRQLAAAMGSPGAGDDLVARVGGHPLFAVEMLRTIAEGAAGSEEGALPAIPPSLRSAVLGRTARAGDDVHDLLSAAAVLGQRFDLATLAALAEVTVEETIRRLDRAHRARLVTVVEREYAFTNDLVHEILYDATPLPVRTARHRTAARLSAGRPEAVGHHAHEGGDWGTAAAAWFAAATSAMDAFANRDAERLLDLALQAVRHSADRELEVRVLLARGRVLERAARYREAFEEHTAARDLARGIGARALEMWALHEMGGDPSVALGRQPDACDAYLQQALAIADEIGEVHAAVDILRRLAVLETNRMRGDEARRHAEAALGRARATGDDLTLAAALDGRKTVAAYVGDLATLERVVGELEPLLARHGQLWLLQWAVFESSLVPLARGAWDAAVERVERALELSRRSGYHAYGAMFLAQRAWIEHARGAYGAAATVAGRARGLAAASKHPWWIAFADAVLGNVLLSIGAERQALEVLEQGLAVADRDGADLYVLRCLGPLAEAEALLGLEARAAASARRVEALVRAREPLFLHAAQGPLGAARAWLVLGEPQRAAALLRRIGQAAESAGWVEPAASAALGLGEVAIATGERSAAWRELERARDRARAAGLVGVVADASAALAALHRMGGGTAANSPERAELEAAAASAYAELRVTLTDPAMLHAFDARAARHLGRTIAPGAPG